MNEGDRYYGYYTMASYLRVQPTAVSARGFTDGAEHRQPLPPVYNQYSLMTEDNGFPAAWDDHQMIYRPLFTTSFVLDDYLDDNEFFGAGTVVVGSASSKTGFGLAWLLHKRRDVKVVGLTSPGNREFVESMGIYDQVLTYSEVESLEQTSTAYVDMSGNREVLARLHHHLGDNIVCSCGVGITHYEATGGEDPSTLPGASPTMFFAPSQIEKRNKDWGPEKFQAELAAAWQGFLGEVDNWVNIEHPQGSDGLVETYRTVLAGASPDRAYVVTL